MNGNRQSILGLGVALVAVACSVAFGVACSSSSSPAGTGDDAGSSSSASTAKSSSSSTKSSSGKSSTNSQTTTSSESSSGSTAASSSSTTSSLSGSTSSASSGSSGSGSGDSGAGCSGATPVALTVLNYDAWCSVKVAGGTGSVSATQTVCVADGAVTLEAVPASSSFQLGDWYGVTGDTGSGDPGTVSNGESTASVTVSGSTACVSVCCPFTGGSGCPGSNQCP